MSEVQATKPMRELMPSTAETADFLRRWLGQGFVDGQIARATKARKTYLAIHAERGKAAAEEWRRLNWREATFYAREAGQSIGIPDPSPEECAVVPNIDPRLLRAAREGGPREAKLLESAIRLSALKGRERTDAEEALGPVQTSALRRAMERWAS